MDIFQNINIAVDAVVFGYSNNQLQVLLIKQKFGLLKGNWALVGGFIHDNESLIDAVQRELKEEAGIAINYLEQLYTFGDRIDRDPRFRVISVAYFALVNPSNFELKADTDAEEVQWFPIDQLPNLAFDHQEIVDKALNRLRNNLSYKPIGFDLLPQEFIFPALENLYCTILNKEIDRRNFRKKIKSFGFIETTNKIEESKAGRPAAYYKFNKDKYLESERNGIHFEINIK